MKVLAHLLVLFALFGSVGCRSAALNSNITTEAGIRVEGNEEVDTSELLRSAARHLAAFVKNDRRPADADDAAFDMQSLLIEQGYPDAEVRFELTDDALVLRVEEGPRAMLGRVRFDGVRALPIEDLQKLFEFGDDGLLGDDTVVYNKPQIDSAVISAQDLYLNAGHRDVVIHPPEATWNNARTSVDVLIRIEEGPKYIVRQVVVAGADRCLLGKEDPTGEPFHTFSGAQAGAHIRRALQDEGYADASVKAAYEIDTDTHAVDITLTVDRGEPVRLRDVIIKGQCHTKKRFIRDRFCLRKGRVIKRRHLESGVADLYRARIFSSVHSKLEPVGPGLADVEIEVEEGEAKRLDFEAGWGSWERLRGEIQYKDFNLFGEGRILRATALASTRSYGGEVELEDRWIFGPDNRGRIRISGYHLDQQFFDYDGFTFDAIFERRFNREHRLWAGYWFVVEQVSDVQSGFSDTERSLEDEFTRSAGLFAKFRRDTRDDRFLPTAGHLIEFAVRWSEPLLGASLSYLAVDSRASYYLKLGGAGVLALGVRFSTNQPFGDTVLPLQNRYFLGGQMSTRSFDQDELTPTDPFGNAIGALTAAEGHVEWRFPIANLIHGGLFYDMGFVSLDPFSFYGDVGHGVGAGLRIYTPVGPIRLDAAYNPGNLFAADSRFQFHVSFGFSF